jgi:hypothetical protein
MKTFAPEKRKRRRKRSHSLALWSFRLAKPLHTGAPNPLPFLRRAALRQAQ